MVLLVLGRKDGCRADLPTLNLVIQVPGPGGSPLKGIVGDHLLDHLLDPVKIGDKFVGLHREKPIIRSVVLVATCRTVLRQTSLVSEFAKDLALDEAVADLECLI